MKKLLYILCMPFLLNSCNMQPEEKITWELQDHPQMLVVECVITNELKQQAMHLTKSSSYFDNSGPESVTGATVEVSDGDETIGFSESKDSAGWYFSEKVFPGKSGKIYQLSIKLTSNINGIKEYKAQSKLPEGLAIDSMKCDIYRMPEIDNGDQEDKKKEKDTTVIALYYFGKEPAGAENFYFAKVFRNGKLLYTNPKEYADFTIAAQNETYTHLIGFNKNVAASDSIRFRLYTIDKEYYHYLESIQNIDFSGNAYSLSGPPANAVGNIEGAFGYFLTAYVSDNKTVAVDKR